VPDKSTLGRHKGHGRTRILLAVITGAVLLLVAVLILAEPFARKSAGGQGAAAEGLVYWTNAGASTISFANLDGSGGGGDLSTTGATVSKPSGLAIDPAAGRIYWANADVATNKISFANLDGSGGGDLNTTGATVSNAFGMAIDPVAGRIYWANAVGNKISFANLDGSGGGDLDTTGASAVDTPIGATIDPAAGRIYWTNSGKISFANLDGTGGGGDLDTTGVSWADFGLAIDAAAGRIYTSWTSGSKISFANLDGSGGGDLAITGTTVSDPRGVAIDPVAGMIYWGNDGTHEISFANLDGSGGGNLDTTGATALYYPAYPALLRVPSGTGVPEITGGSAFGSTLSCSQGSWGPDLLGAFLYRAPQSFAYRWSRDGADISGASSRLITANSPGEYRCRVTATNHAGSRAQTSDPHTVQPGPPPLQPTSSPSNSLTLGKPKLNNKNGTAKLPVTVPGPGTLVLSGKTVAKQRATPKQAGNVKLLIKPKGSAKSKLNSAGKVKVKVKVAYTPTGGTARTKTKTIKLLKRLD
jgi:DNA-binding beta-propeller fold protein YncE